MADILASGAAVFLVVAGLGHDSVSLPMLAAAPIVVVVGKVLGLYDRDEHLVRKSTLDEAPELFQVSTLVALLTWLAGEAVVSGELDRGQVLGLWALLFVFMVLARAGARRLVTAAVPTERCLVLGDAELASRISSTFKRSPQIKAEVVAALPLAVGKRRGEHSPELACPQSLTEALTQYEVHRVIVAPTSADSEEILSTIRVAQSLGVKISVFPRLFEAIGSVAKYDHADGVTLLGVPTHGLSQSSLFLKRCMDLAGAVVLLCLSAPLLLGLAVGVTLTSKGPLLFRQTRIGRDGREFQMFKFRSMVDGADDQKESLLFLNQADGLFKIPEDPRVTPFGRFMRRFSLDELPQLVNVLRGEMSLVGPRPLVPDEAWRAEGWQRRRLQVPPGMTGVWQILGSARIPFREMANLDYLYGASWSPWLDLKILLRTVPYVLGRRGM